jgi:transposase-like protein
MGIGKRHRNIREIFLEHYQSMLLRRRAGAQEHRSELSESIKNDEKRDRRKLPQETEQAIVKSLGSGASISETAREHEVSKSVVHKLKKQGAKPKPAKATSSGTLTISPFAPAPVRLEKQKNSEAVTSDPINEWIATMWRTYRGETVTPDLFKTFIGDALEAPATLSVMFEAFEAFKHE